MRTAALGLIGLVLAVAVGFGVHLITRDTISLPVVQLEQSRPLAPPAATAGRTTTGQTTTTETETETERPATETETDPETTTETEDNSGSGSSGSGRGRGRGRSDDDD